MKKLVFGFTLFIACGLQAQQKNSTWEPIVHTISGDVRGGTE